MVGPAPAIGRMTFPDEHKQEPSPTNLQTLQKLHCNLQYSSPVDTQTCTAATAAAAAAAAAAAPALLPPPPPPAAAAADSGWATSTLSTINYSYNDCFHLFWLLLLSLYSCG
eukprot:gene9405-biopygen1304